MQMTLSDRSTPDFTPSPNRQLCTGHLQAPVRPLSTQCGRFPNHSSLRCCLCPQRYLPSALEWVPIITATFHVNHCDSHIRRLLSLILQGLALTPILSCELLLHAPWHLGPHCNTSHSKSSVPTYGFSHQWG